MKIHLEHIACDLCGCKEYKIRYRQPDMWLWLNQFEFPVVECINCGLVYVNPRPTEESMAVYYPEHYHEERNTEEHMNRYKRQSKYLLDLNYKKVLDIGCARGDFLAFLKNLYPKMECYGVDLYSSHVDYSFINFQSKSLQDCNFNSNTFDVIISFAVFEHLHYPSKYFKECGRILKSGGVMYILVTNSESFYSKYARQEDIPRHLYHYNKKTLKRYGELSNLKLKEIIYTDEIFDGRGKGAIKWFTSNLLGVKYENYYFRNINLLIRVILKVADILDRIIFHFHWEKTLKRSGVILAKYVKE